MHVIYNDDQVKWLVWRISSNNFMQLVEVPKLHDVIGLFDLCSDIIYDFDVLSLLFHAKILNLFVLPLRR